MNAVIRSDDAKGPGHAIIQVTDAPGLLSSSGSGKSSFTLLRAADRKFLGHEGWQESKRLLEPDAVAEEGGAIHLSVGPLVVDNLDSLDSYRIEFQDAVCPLRLETLRTSNMTGGQGMGVPETPTPAPAPVPDPIPEPAEPIGDEGSETPGPLPVGPEPEPPRRKAVLPILLILLLLLGLSAGGAFLYLRHQDKQQADAPSQQEPSQAAEAPGASKTSQETPPASQESPQQQAAGALPPLAAARELLRTYPEPERTLPQGEALRTDSATPEASDAAFLLLEDAAQKGNPRAMLLVGGFYDPASTLPRGSIAVNLAQAKHWYEQADKAGNADAKAALERLRTAIQAQADKGDEEARELLRTWR